MTPAARARRRVRTPVVVVTAVAWASLAFATAAGGTDAAGRAMPMGSAHPSHGHAGPGLAWVTMPALMLIAMMAPMTVAPLRHVVERSFRRRRRRAAALTLAGYAATWTGAGVLLATASYAIRAALPATVAAGLAVAVGVAWQWSPPKQYCLNRTHTHRELVAFGRAADVDAARFGVEHGIRCVGSCWALMLVPMVVDRGYPAAMIFVTLWLWAERFDRPRSPAWSVRGPARAARLAIAAARTRLLLPAEPAGHRRHGDLLDVAQQRLDLHGGQ